MGTVRLARALAETNRPLTAAVFSISALSGLLLPVFALATGWLVGALRAAHPTTAPLLLVIGAFAAGLLLDPAWQVSTQALARQVDEQLTRRVMAAVAGPPGLGHVEDPVLLDRVTQAQGAVTGVTPGRAASLLGEVGSYWAQGLGSLALVASYRIWLAAVLLAAYAIRFRLARQHWHHVTLVMYGRTSRLRRSYYLRRLALGSAIAKETRVFGLANWLVDRYRQGWLAEMRQVWSARQSGWPTSLLTTALLAAVEGLAVALVGRDAVHGHLGLGTTVVVAQAILGASVLGQYQEENWALSECAGSLARIEELEAEVASARGVSGGTRSAAGLPTEAISFENVTFTYPGRDEPVLVGFDLRLEAGRSLAIVGENGSGKTTLIKLLCRFYDPDRGAVRVDGVDLRELDVESWHERIAAVFQDYVQFELSAYDNIAFGALSRSDDADAVEDAARLAGADGIVGRLPAGWSTPLSRQFSSGSQLSGGEWQRLALARALFAVRAGAGVLILDEPTAALDVRGEAEVYNRFLELTRGATTIVVSHRFSTVRRADRIVVIEEGRVVEDGSHDELVGAGGRYSTMYRVQAARFGNGDA